MDSNGGRLAHTDGVVKGSGFEGETSSSLLPAHPLSRRERGSIGRVVLRLPDGKRLSSQDLVREVFDYLKPIAKTTAPGAELNEAKTKIYPVLAKGARLSEIDNGNGKATMG